MPSIPQRRRRSAQNQEIRLQTELNKPLSLVENISTFFFQSAQTELLATKQNLASKIRRTRTEYETAVAKVTLIYDVWPTYPPDWDERRQLVSERDHYSCNHCGISGNHHLHHIRALSQGQTQHKIRQHALLCEPCHSDAHGGRRFRYEPRNRRADHDRKENCSYQQSVGPAQRYSLPLQKTGWNYHKA